MSVQDPPNAELHLSRALLDKIQEGARKLHLSDEAFLAYLLERTQPGVDVARFDRHVREAFGRHGELLRRLAK